MNSESALKARRGCSPFAPAELKAFKMLLYKQQTIALRDLGGLSDAARRTVGDVASGASSLPGHLAELASETFDQELSLEFMGRTRDDLEEIQSAIERIEFRCYGLCEDCAKDIPVARLEAMPTARFCIDCKSRREQQ
jgi:DnaK suppressor protein